MQTHQEGAIAPSLVRDASHRPTLREARFSDHPRIADLLERNGLRTRTTNDWIRLWEENPAYRDFPGKWPIGWVLETVQGQIVGSIVNVPAAYFWKGKLLWAATECDWAVDRPYRTHSLRLLQSLTNQPDVDLVLTTTAGASAEPGYAALRWSKTPVGRWDRADFWVTGYQGFAESALRTRSKRLPAVLLRYPLSAGLLCRDAIFHREARLPQAIQVEPCREFDARFDVFWEKLKRRKRNVLLAMRNRATLSWHFRPTPDSIWIATVSNASGLVAYAVFARRDNPDVGLKRIRLVDFQSLQEPERMLREILSWAIQRCRREEIHVLEDLGCLASAFGVKAAYHRPLDSWAYYYRVKRQDLNDSLAHADVWEPTSYDGDASLS